MVSSLRTGREEGSGAQDWRMQRLFTNAIIISPRPCSMRKRCDGRLRPRTYCVVPVPAANLLQPSGPGLSSCDLAGPSYRVKISPARGSAVAIVSLLPVPRSWAKHTAEPQMELGRRGNGQSRRVHFRRFIVQIDHPTAEALQPKFQLRASQELLVTTFGVPSLLRCSVITRV